MKSITEFALPTLQKFTAAKAALTTEGKTAEEITAALTESFKLEGDKFKYMSAAADLAAAATGKAAVRRVMVVSFAEGEVAPAKYQNVEDTHYLVETLELAKPAAAAAPQKGRGGPRKGGERSGPKSSPWGASPEELAAKKKASIEASKRQ